MNIQIETNLDELRRAFSDYVLLSGKSLEEALRKQGAKLAFNLRQELRRLAPAKGSIRQQAEALLKSGRGIKVRESVLAKVYGQRGARSLLGSRKVVFGKRGRGTTTGGLTLRALAVQREINLRESARGFLSVSTIYRGLGGQLERPVRAVSRLGPTLSTAGVKVSESSGSIEFLWSPAMSELSGQAAEGINTAKGEAAVERALAGTLEDIEEYIHRKLIGA